VGAKLSRLVWAEAFSGELTVGRRLNAGEKGSNGSGCLVCPV
jgi:hypothetical protein